MERFTRKKIVTAVKSGGPDLCNPFKGSRRTNVQGRNIIWMNGRVRKKKKPKLKKKKGRQKKNHDAFESTDTAALQNLILPNVKREG